MKNEQEKRKIFLIGFMGAGKSYIGRALRKKLGWKLFDLDQEIQNKSGQTINEIFQDLGENAFRNLERECLQELIKLNKDLIISTGGGAPCFFDNMKIMKDNGLTIYISKTVENLLFNLSKGVDKRPLIRGKSSKEIEDYIESKLKERNKYYRQAQFTVHDFRDEDLVDTIYQKTKELFN